MMTAEILVGRTPGARDSSLPCAHAGDEMGHANRVG